MSVNRRSPKAIRGVAAARRAASSSSGIDRVSCAWRDGVGPGFATGVTEGVARTISALNSARYCR